MRKHIVIEIEQLTVGETTIKNLLIKGPPHFVSQALDAILHVDQGPTWTYTTTTGGVPSDPTS